MSATLQLPFTSPGSSNYGKNDGNIHGRVSGRFIHDTSSALFLSSIFFFFFFFFF